MTASFAPFLPYFIAAGLAGPWYPASMQVFLTSSPVRRPAEAAKRALDTISQEKRQSAVPQLLTASLSPFEDNADSNLTSPL